MNEPSTEAFEAFVSLLFGRIFQYFEFSKNGICAGDGCPVNEPIRRTVNSGADVRLINDKASLGSKDRKFIRVQGFNERFAIKLDHNAAG